MLKFVVTKKSNRSSTKKQLKRVAKSLTPTKKHDKTSKGMDSSLDSSVISTLVKFHRAPSPPTSLLDGVARKRENVVSKYEKLFQSTKEKTDNSFEEQRQKASPKRAVAKKVSFKETDLYVTRSVEKGAHLNISQPNVNQDFSKTTGNYSIDQEIVNKNDSLNVSKLSINLETSRVTRINLLNISHFRLNSSLDELSFYMQMYDNQLKRIKHKTDKLRERDTVIRQKFEAVRRKAKRLNIIDRREDYDLMNQNSPSDESVLKPSQHFRRYCNEDESVTMKPSDETSVFDNSVCVTKNNLNKTAMGLSSMSVARKKHLRRSFNSPKRLQHQRVAQKLPRLTSPLARSAREFSSTRDVILCALSKDNRKFTFC